ncbi:MAG: hypothetical protein AAB898_00200 [Patescibacteria group bacterium]
MKRLIFLCLLFAVLPAFSRAATFDPDYIMADRDMTNKDALSLEGIQSFLTDKGGTLGAYVTQDLDGKTKRASDIIHRVAQTFSMSPKFILVMLQKEQSLVTDSSPVQGQFDWATGYAVCDGCNVNTAGVSRFKGFAKQIDSMAQQFRLGYLPDLEMRGETQTKIAPGQTTMIDGVSVTPLNDATAAMYTYTPHIEGNQNAWRIWNTWFSHPDYPSGTLLRGIQDGSLWLIKYGKRREIGSEAVLRSLYNPESVIDVDTSVVSAYEEGRPISFPNYALVRVENGDVYLLVDSQKRRFLSTEDLPKFGYSPEEILEATEDDLADYESGTTIAYQTAYPQGAVFQHPDTKALFYVYNGMRHIVVSEHIRAARFGGWRTRPITSAELESYPEGGAMTFPDGTLTKLPTDPTVYVISDGKRRPIIDEETFTTLGYQWEDILVTDAPSIEVHQPGALITIH